VHLIDDRILVPERFGGQRPGRAATPQSLIFHGKRQRVRLDPSDLPFAIWRLDNPGRRRYGQAP